MQIGEPSLDEGRLLFTVNRGPYLSEFTLISKDEAVVGAAADKLPPEFAGPEHQRAIEWHRVRLLRQRETAT
jgi:hypothetical protein